MVHTLAKEVMSLDEEIAQVNALIEGRLREHPDAKVITSTPGIGAMLGPEFIAATGDDIAAFGSPDRLAGVPDSPPFPATPARSAGTCAGPGAIADGSCGCSTSPLSPPLCTALSPRRSTHANMPRESPTSRPSSPWPGAASTCSGPSYATAGPSKRISQAL